MPSFVRSLILVLCLSLFLPANAQVSYPRWWEYEKRAEKLTSEQFSLATQLAQQGDVDSEMLLAVVYKQGIGVPSSRKEYLNWLQRAAQHGAPEAQFTLANLYKQGTESFDADPAQVVVWTRRAAEQSHMVAMLNLGSMYLHGVPTLPRDVAQGEMWLTRSAEAGFTHAQLLLGDLYLKGEDRPRDPEKGEYWLRRAAERGHVMAMLRLAQIYSSTEEVPRDPDFVETILLRASEMRRPEPQYYLARMYRRGLFGTVNLPRALEWLEISYAKKYAPATFTLGEMHEKGEGVPTNPAGAAHLYLEAASLGFSPAVCKAGDIHYRGQGVPQNNAEAYRWYLIGARKGAAECVAGQRRLENELKESQRQDVATDAEAWITAHPREMAQPLGKYRWPFGVWVPDDPPLEPLPPSTAEDRAEVVKVVRAMELDPVGPARDKSALWLWDWMQRVPDFFFLSCEWNLLEPAKGKTPYRYRKEMEWQVYFSGAAYQIQHPKAKDQIAIYHAGVLGALRAYEAVIARDPKVRWPVMDALLERRAKGPLLEFVHQQANRNCR